MKCYGLTTTPGPQWGAATSQVRVIVAAPNRKRAAEALRAAGLGYSDYAFGQYSTETGNEVERAAGFAAPGVVLWANEGGNREQRDYHAVGRCAVSDYDDDRPGMMRVHIAQQRGQELADKYSRDSLRELAYKHGVPIGHKLKIDLAVALAMKGVKP